MDFRESILGIESDVHGCEKRLKDLRRSCPEKYRDELKLLRAFLHTVKNDLQRIAHEEAGALSNEVSDELS